MSDLPALWTPSKFDGSDMLPVLRAPDPDGEELVGRDNVSQKDLSLPSIRLLQGMSPEVVKNEVEGARAGLVLHTGTQQLLKPPLRVMFVHHSKSNLLAPDPTKPEHAGLQRCLSKDTVTGDVYGDCEICKKCTEWGPRTAANPKGTKPLGSQSHNFVCVTELGPAIMRFSRTSFQAARTFITTWVTGGKNLWAHPVVVRVKQETQTLANGQQSVYYTWEPIWQMNDQIPKPLREFARHMHDTAEAAYQAGRMTVTGETDVPDQP